MKPLTFTVIGKPVPQPRARVLRCGRSYTPDNGIIAYRKALATAASEAGAEKTKDAPLTIILDFVFVRPKSHFKANGELNQRTALKKPPGDWDNYAKGVQDALKGIAYVDDSQIAKGIAEMTYGTEARTTVRIQ